jgi:hypothetical protein
LTEQRLGQKRPVLRENVKPGEPAFLLVESIKIISAILDFAERFVFFYSGLIFFPS